MGSLGEAGGGRFQRSVQTRNIGLLTEKDLQRKRGWFLGFKCWFLGFKCWFLGLKCWFLGFKCHIESRFVTLLTAVVFIPLM